MRVVRALTILFSVCCGLDGPSAASCTPVGDIHFICGVVSPEDLAVVPGGQWVIVSGDREGGRLQLTSVHKKNAVPLFPSHDVTERLDKDAYPSCPGPIDPKEGNDFRAHGLYLKPGPNAIHTLYVVHHGFRESIEVFEVNVRSGRPRLTWVGCAIAPAPLVLNAVVALPEGGFATSSTQMGDVWEWHAETGWQRMPGSEGTAANGLEISKDGRWLYIAGWAEEKVTRLWRAQSPGRKDVIALGFRPDNLRMSLDGSAIYAAGHGNVQTPRQFSQETSNVARIDPRSLEFRRIFSHPNMEGFGAATTAIAIGKEMWLGTYRGERVAYFLAPK